jgi:hypothetical protein
LCSNFVWSNDKNKGIFFYPSCLSLRNFRLEVSMHRTPISLGALGGLRTTMPAEDERTNKKDKLALTKAFYYITVLS